MVFSSPIFLFLFLPLTLAAYFVAPRRLRNAVLLATSLFFYAWGEKAFVLLMLASILVNYLLGRWLQAWRDHNAGKVLLALGVGGNLGLLIVFKYANFLVANANEALGLTGVAPISVSSIHLPIGISFFVFEAIAYLIDIRRGAADAQRDVVKFGLFMTLFPHLIAGPVVRYRDLAAALDNRNVSRAQFAAGVRRFIVGLAKKVLLANTLARTADMVFDHDPAYLAMSAAWLGVLCYTLHIYFDFSGYSDMAVGLGRMFGFELCENFRYPYAASSVTEFWRRWHISLSTWFRDYLYVPLGGNRRGVIRTAINLCTVFVLCGLWHGASWTFLAWGLYHGLFLVVERLGSRRESIIARALGHVYTLIVVMIGWVLFRCETIMGAGGMLYSMVGLGDGVRSAADYWNCELALALGIGAIACQPVWPLLRGWRERLALARPAAGAAVEMVQLILLLAALTLCTTALAAGTFNPFIYFRF